MKPTAPLQPGRYYHIYDRGNNREDLFREDGIIATLCNCTLDMSIPSRTRSLTVCCGTTFTCWYGSSRPHRSPRPVRSWRPAGSPHFSNLFNAYTKAINKAYGRTGSLFAERFGRIAVTSDRYFLQLITYIHLNSQKHGFVDDFREWPWSSYHALRGAGDTRLDRTEVLGWFGNRAQFESLHRGMVDEAAIAALIEVDLA